VVQQIMAMRNYGTVELVTGTAGVCRLDDEEDLGRFVQRLDSDHTPDRFERWLVLVGSMSRKHRRSMLHRLEGLGYPSRRFTWSDRRKAASMPDPFRPPWWQRMVGAGFALTFGLPVLIGNTGGKLVGRGIRQYIVYAPPQPSTPPSAGVREPRRPSPSNDAGTISPD